MASEPNQQLIGSPAIFSYLRDTVYRHSGIHISDKELGVLETRITGRARSLGVES